MGAGKTSFAKALAQGLGVRSEVDSPTFALVNEYAAGNQRLYHFDLYRLKDIDELLGIGFEDYLDEDAFFIIEWPQLAMPLLEPPYLLLEILLETDGSRVIEIESH